MPKKAISIALLVTGFFVSCLIGLYVGAYNLWPTPLVREIRQLLRPSGNAPVKYDAHGFLISYPDKTEVPCPAQTDRTMILVPAGQSNAGNSGGQRFASEYGGKVINWFAGRCYIASSPLLGMGGDGGEVWTALGNRLISEGVYDQIIIAPISLGGSNIAQWHSGHMAAEMEQRLKLLASQYSVTDFVWVQGEADAVQGTSLNEYKRKLEELMSRVLAQHPKAKIFINVSTYCGGNIRWRDKNPVQLALRSSVAPERGIFMGVDMDLVIKPIDRRDECHLGASGQAKLVDGLVSAVRAARELPRIMN